MERLNPQEYIIECAMGDPALEKLGVYVKHGDVQPGAAFDVPIDADQILPAQRTKIVPVLYYELGTNYEDALEGQFIIGHFFRIDCRAEKYEKAEEIRQSLIATLRRGLDGESRLIRESSRFDAFEPNFGEKGFYRRIQEIVIEP